MGVAAARPTQGFMKRHCKLQSTYKSKVAKFNRNTINPRTFSDEWLFDTVKAPTTPQFCGNTKKRRKLSITSSANEQSIRPGPEEAMKQLHIKDASPSCTSPQNNIAHGTVHRQLSSKKNKYSVDQNTMGDKRRLPQPDLSFGNTGSTVRLFRRVSDSHSTHLKDDVTSLSASREEQGSPSTSLGCKESVLGRQIFSQAIDPSLKEIYAQTCSHAKREKLVQLADAWGALDAIDPEGEYQILKLILEKIYAAPNLCVNLCPSITSSFQSSPNVKEHESPKKLARAHNNPRLESHRRRQTSILSESNFKEKLSNLPGQIVPGMEHTTQLADVLYSRWADGLRSRWPAL